MSPSLPKGTRDFGPVEMGRRNHILNMIRSIFEKFGYNQIETPSLENLSVLTGKYGDEGDKLLFKILNSGNYLEKVSNEDLVEGVKIVTPKVSKKGLRYDLTVPFARYVAMNRNDISLPFKRYQIQPVWRADRPQKGRYQEFYQCDADVIGTKSLISEAEIILMIHEALEQLGIVDFTVKINHRAVLAGIVECLGVKGQESSFYVAVDKLDKIGLDQVKSELFKNGFPKSALENLGSFLDIEGSNEQKIKQLQKEFDTRNIDSTGLEAIKKVLKIVDQFGLANSKVSFDTTLARGLSYYTGAIFEVIVNNVKIGSISGGGRYDDLTGAFGWPDMPGIGVFLWG